MRYVVKGLLHTLLLAATVYIFYFKADIGAYGWWQWTWTILLSIVGLFNYIPLLAAKDDTTEKGESNGWLCLFGFIDFLMTLSICLLSEYYGFQDPLFLLSCIGVYILASGLNQFTFSIAFSTLSVILFLSFNHFSTWHVWTVFVLCIIGHLSSILAVVANKMDVDDVPNVELIGIVVAGLVLVYSYLVGDLCFSDSSIALTTLVYIQICLLASLRDNVFMFFAALLATGCYSIIFLLPWDDAVSIFLLFSFIIFSLLGMHAYFTYKKYMSYALQYIYSENQKTIKEYNKMVDNYNSLVEQVKNIRSSGSGPSHQQSAFWRGAEGAAGRSLFDSACELLGTLFS